ncbi:hypothetical protein CMQ_3945 [Grosmannia clavigera kw1407]|uniref:Uncharacterized protein n=1 Tax=Grosmannia clavigera (strain kw1407 / UAMH 11150) TaxID=655863 RepID=F0XAJ9_GROCL|nr:uncharacterized protein CMQ_3945 [Grosmannia clavigera kw1407]EFX05876.1 hypothetical protein CMQ_3945 [Grosmannia clavigera kw1407]
MNRPALCSVLERVPRRILPSSAIALRSAAAAVFFSTTPSQRKLKQVPARRDRVAAAASEVGALGAAGAFGRGDGDKAAAAVPVADARSLGAPRPAMAAGGSSSGNLTSSNAITASSTISASKVINMRSLPRRPSNGGGGGSSFPGPTGVWSGFSGNARTGRFAGSRMGGIGGGAGAGGGRNGGRASGRAGGAGGGRKRRPMKRRGKGGEDEEGGGKRGQQQEPNALTVQEQTWLEEREVGTATTYRPSLTRESLEGYGPAVASSTSAAANTGAVLRAMRVLGGGMPFCAELPNPTAAYDRLMSGQPVFFDSVAERTAAEEALLSKRLVKQLSKNGQDGKDGKALRAIAPVRVATKTAILDTTVRGLYANGDSQTATGGGAVFEALRRYRSKDATWSAAAGRAVENKVRSLLPAMAGSKGGQAARQ